MSANFFAALDDSGDEAPKKAPAKKETKGATKPAAAVAPSTKAPRRQPNNDRNTKHGRGGRAPARDGKRAYDRRSGTGRGKEIKKGGGGARNWGNDKAEAKKMEGAIDEKVVDKPADEAEIAAEEPEIAEPEPEPDNTMTLAEYMAAKEKKEEKVREVENEFAGKAAAKKVEEDFLVLGEGKSKKKKQLKDNKKTLDVNFRVAPSNISDGGRGEGRGRGRGGRGGRGEGRGGRGEGRGGRGRGRDGGRGRGRGGRGGRGEGRGGGRGRGASAGRINVNDENAFPSL